MSSSILSKFKHNLFLPKEKSASPQNFPKLTLFNEVFPYPPFTTYKWKIAEKDNNADKIEIEKDGFSCSCLQEGGSSQENVYFKFKEDGNFKIQIDRLKEGYDDIIVETYEIEIEVV